MQDPTIAAPDMDKYWQKALEFSGDTQLHHLVLQDRLKKIPVLSQDPKKKTSKKQDAEELMVYVRNTIKGAGLEKLGAANKRGDTPLHLAVARGGRKGTRSAFTCASGSSSSRRRRQCCSGRRPWKIAWERHPSSLPPSMATWTPSSSSMLCIPLRSRPLAAIIQGMMATLSSTLPFWGNTLVR